VDRFQRRIYSGIRPLLHDFRTLLARRSLIRSVMRDKQPDPAFRERLMLVVTGVNGCRYCSYVHARAALEAGISPEQIEALGAAQFFGSPIEELPALLYAQHWAEADGHPTPEVRQRIRRQYGDGHVERIETVLLMIRVGNLVGNTFDYLLHRISLGRWGDRAAGGS